MTLRRPSTPVRKTRSSSALPGSFRWFFDAIVPEHVKRRYAPDPRWRERPFGLEDAKFFSRGIRELSALLTEDRPTPRRGARNERLPRYFREARFRSSYLLYFLPMQAAKFIWAFERHAAALASLPTGAPVWRVADLGAGPGTASLAWLLWLIEDQSPIGAHRAPALPDRIELEWWDQEPAILREGEALVEALAREQPLLRDAQGRSRIRITSHVDPWQRPGLRDGVRFDLTLLGHTLNEGGSSDEDEAELAAWLDRTGPSGMLVIEPAERRVAQRLARFRDRYLEYRGEAGGVWGPCLHTQACPLAQGRDWCHFSEPLVIDTQWHAGFSRALGSERDWLKLCYVWMRGESAGRSAASASGRLVVSDPFRGPSGATEVLVCAPNKPERLRLTGTQARELRRGVVIAEGSSPGRRPPTRR